LFSGDTKFNQDQQRPLLSTWKVTQVFDLYGNADMINGRDGGGDTEQLLSISGLPDPNNLVTN
jgi:hypothetical protein